MELHEPPLSLIWNATNLVAAEVWRLYWMEEPKTSQQVGSLFGEPCYSFRDIMGMPR